MEQFEEQLPLENSGQDPGTAEATVVYTPKYFKKNEPVNMWLKSFVSLALYLILGYYIFHSFNMLLIITAIVIFHELGHFIAMKAFRYKDLGIFFIPLLGAYVSGTKREVSQKESAIILLAGPLPGIAAGIIIYMLGEKDPDLTILNISYYQVSMLLIFLNLINLLPIYPLDGGQLLNRVFLDEESWISKAFVFLSAAFMVWVAWKLNFWVLLIFPTMMLLRLQTDKKLKAAEQRIEDEGINMDISYENLPDKDYWHIRQILIEEHPSFRDIEPAPPYEYDPKEERIMTTIQSLLHRHLIQDLSVVGKIVVILITIAAFASPWLFNMDLGFFGRFGF